MEALIGQDAELGAAAGAAAAGSERETTSVRGDQNSVSGRGERQQQQRRIPEALPQLRPAG